MRNTAAHTHRLWRRIPSWSRLALSALAVLAALVQLAGSSAAVTATPDQVGQWSAPAAWPIVAVHMALEPTGQVLAWDGWDNAPNSERLWDPQSQSFFPIPYGRNLFCAGHIELADGRTLIIGGHVDADLGLADTTIFDSKTDTYTRAPDMSVGRWYPTATALPDGRVLAFAGDNIVQNRPGAPHALSDASVNSLPSIFNPKTNAWTDLTTAQLTSPLYPYMFVLSDGRVFDAGPDTTTRILNPATATWTTVGTSPIDGMSAVMYRPNKIMKAGTWADPDFNGTLAYTATGGTAVIDMSAPTPTWRSTAPMAFGRSYNNLTLLPDGTVLASGGMTSSDGTDLNNAVLPAEIWNPDTETWTTVASLQNGREYHSTALLLPDGRVLMAGGGALPGRATDEKNAEIYSPPYLFKGARPTITNAPASAAYGANFDVTTPNAAQIAKVSLIRLASVTHGFDQNQRFQFLTYTAGAGKITVQAPANANLAPPGDYLLFLVDGNGVPSVGSFIRVSSTGDITPPTTPSPLSATTSPGQVVLSWPASTDAGGIANYNVYRSTTSGFTPSTGNRIAQPAGVGYTDTLLPAGTYYYKVTAEDVAGNVSAVSNEVSATVSGGPAVLALSFDAGTGTTAADGSGNGNNGTIANATWSTAGKFGNALSFNGTNAMVTVPDSNSLDLTTQMTIEGWVKPTVSTGWQALLVKEQPGNLVYGLYSNSDTNRPQSQVTTGAVKLLDGTSTLPAGAWSHLAATYDGTTQRLYVNGTQVASVATTGPITTSSSPVRVGGDSIWSEWFNGLIDEVRVYNRALSPAEIQSDMTTPISAPDSTPPSAPGTLTATGGLGKVTLNWAAATDNVGVSRYNVHRGTSPGFAISSANRVAQPAGTTYTDTGLAAGTYYYKVTAEDAAGNVGPAGNEANATATSDTTPPTAPTGLTANAVPGQVTLSWTAATDAGGIARYTVYRSTTSGFTPAPANQIAQPTGTSYIDSGLSPGTYYYRVVAQDNAGNVGPPSSEASAVVPVGPPPGLVAAYGFDAGSGTTATDQSGSGNTGTLSNATWSAGGKFGSALSFNGTNSSVSIPDSNSLDLTTGMTIEGWVKPTSGGGWQTLIFKERPGNLAYGLYSNSDTNRPQSQVTVAGTVHLLDGTATVPAGLWTHLAATFDGTTQRLYVNGTQVSSLASSGSILTSTSPLKIGGNAIWGEWFNGLIDEVRVYNRALSAAEIQSDMTTPLSSTDSTPPSAPGTLTAVGSLSSAQLSWGAATDNIGVARYDVYRSTTSGFTPSAGNRIAQPTTTSYTDNTAPGTYYYKITAEDAAGNIGPAGNEASAAVGDTSAPTAPTTLNATGAVGTATLTWSAATDNVGVVKYNVHRGTSPGFTPLPANKIAQPTGTSYTDTTTAGTYYYKVTAEDAAGNVGAPSPEASATVTADTSPPSAPGSLAGPVTGSTVNLSWSASTDNVGVVRYNVHRSTTSGFTPSAANRIAQPTGTSFADTGLPTGTYYYRVTAEDAAGNVGAPSNELSATVADATAPSAVTGLTASVAGSTVNLSWSAATDNVGVVRYNVHRGTSAGFTPSAANRIAQPTGLSYSDAGLAPGSYFYKVTAEDAAGNVGAVSNTASATVPDTTAPTAPASFTAVGGPGQVTLSWSASTDNVGVVRYNVHRGTSSGFAPTAANRVAQPTSTNYVDTGLAAGTYYYRVTAEDAAGNVSSASSEAVATATTPPPTGLVAAYGFDAGSGTTAVDQSGSGNTGAISNATWSPSGKFGSALSFNGGNSFVSIPDSNSLDLTTGMTIEGWVKPTSGGGWQTLIFKEQPGNLVYGLYANTDTNKPQSQVSVGGTVRLLDGTATVPAGLWTHLAATFDGTTQRLYVNGTQVSSLASSGSILTSTSPLKIGGNAIWGEWFNGLIDEVRVYNRALTAAQIQSDMTTSITPPDSVPPSAPGTLTATDGVGKVTLAWGAATDNIGIARYDVYRSTTSGFTPSAANRIAQPTTTSYTDNTAPGTYYYKITAEDAAGNIGPAGNEANGTASADTTAPSAPTTLTATGAPGQVALSWGASFDAGGIAHYNVHRGTTAGFMPLPSNRVAQPTGTAQIDTGLAPGTYYYKVTAEDPSGNISAPSNEVSATVPVGPPPGLVAAYGFDVGSGTSAPDQSGNNNNGTLSNATWSAAGKFGKALSFNGTNASVSIPDANSLDLTTGMTVEGWVKSTTATGWQTFLVKERPGDLAYGAYASTSSNKPQAQVDVGGTQRILDATAAVPAGVWTHLAATYDGSTERLYLNGTQVGSLAVSGSIVTSTSPMKIGGNSIWGEWFNGLIDEVRVYNRALSSAEIQNDMNVSVTPDTTPPTVTATTPANGTTGAQVGTSPTVTFSEAMKAATITSSTIQLKDSSNAVVPATVTYDSASNVATLTPQGALIYGASYTVTAKGGAGGVTDYVGNALASDVTWSFTTEASPPPVLVLTSTANPFGSYVGEILRNEGLDAFTSVDVSFVTPTLLNNFDVVLLGDTPVSAATVTALTQWVNAGGNLIAMHPDKQLAGLLGVTDAGSTLANAYLKVDTSVSPGAGIVGSTIQFHGTADKYTLNGATAVATLYSGPATATTNPAVTLRSVGTSGGQAAAFTYDLARSVVYTRQGNPAWVGQERDGVSGIRPDDLFYGAKAGDVQPDWLDTSRIAIPQADEQQRLLVNLITTMERDKMPLPHFWYLPRGKKAVVVLSGDDHGPTNSPGYTAEHFDRFKVLSAAGCVVANWECVRATSFMFAANPITPAQAATYASQGFEMALHPVVASCPTATMTQSELSAYFDTQLTQFTSRYTTLPSPVSNRIHCVYWPDWASTAKVELAHGMRMDANYYHFPSAWIGNKPGFMNGGGFPMRFADLDGTIIDVYQQNTNMNDEAGQVYPSTVDTLLDNALGPQGYYGAFGVNIHNDTPAPSPEDEAIVASAQARGVPLISYKQMLDWVDGRNSSTIRALSWSAGTLTFATTVATGANGLQTMLPTQGPTGTLSALTCAGSARSYTLQTVKGLQYAMFDAVTGTCQATYS